MNDSVRELASAPAPARAPLAAAPRIEVGRLDDPAEHEAERIGAKLPRSVEEIAALVRTVAG